MLSRYEQQQIARATVANSVGTLPGQFDRVPVIKMPQLRVRALTPTFYVHGRVAEQGAVYSIDADEARGLVMRSLAERVS
jgi:hypothetical protein